MCGLFASWIKDNCKVKIFIYANDASDMAFFVKSKLHLRDF
jgi:hypothetical protein